ncbi:endonuclease [Microcystis phage vB_MweS-yong2]|nr:endonuclease [Microcystis phage vB_MweS-yong2]
MRALPDIEPSSAAREILASADRLRSGARGFAFGMVVGLFVGWATPARAEPVDGRRVYVIDGDTVRLPARGSSPGETVRLWNIDAPETSRARCEAEAALGYRAKERLAQMLRSGRVTLTRCEPAAPGRAPRCEDRYGRTLGALSVDGRDVGEAMIAEGLATRWPQRRDWCGLGR